MRIIYCLFSLQESDKSQTPRRESVVVMSDLNQKWLSKRISLEFELKNICLKHATICSNNKLEYISTSSVNLQQQNNCISPNVSNLFENYNDLNNVLAKKIIYVSFFYRQ